MQSREEDAHAAIAGADILNLYEQIASDVHIEEVLRQSAVAATTVLNAERATVYRVIEETRELESVAVIGNVGQTIRVPIQRTSLAGYCADSRKTLLVPDAYGDLSSIDPELRFDSSWDLRTGFRTRDVLCAPAEFNGKLLGVVQALNSCGEPFGEDAVAKMETLTRLIAFALHHAGIYEELATMKCLKKQKAQFMRVMVHELKSPVAGSKMLATGLLYANRTSSKLSNVLGRISKRMDDLLQMVEDILHLSQVQEGVPLGKIDNLDLVALTRHHSEPHRETAEAKGLTFELELPAEPVIVRFDEQGFKLILSNLVSNAVKYTAEGTVSVRLFTEDDTAVLAVRDSGIGIPQEDIPKMFQEFFRASNARGSKIKGTGVGLAGAKEIVERFGGRIEFASEQNLGSEFVVRLPTTS